MTPQEQREAIAEACGGKDPHWNCPRCGRVESSHVSYEERHAIDGCLQFVHWVESPDYLNDLNAMHEVEKSLTDYQHVEFRKHLGEIVGDNRFFIRRFVSSTAAQRAEAFLKTIGKWKS